MSTTKYQGAPVGDNHRRGIRAARRLRSADDEDEFMVIRTMVAVAFFLGCVVVMHKMFWMLEQCVPLTQEAASQARARRWKGAVAAVVIGAWVCAGGIAFGLHMPKVLCAVVFAGPMAITAPVLVWVFLVY